MSNLSKDMPEYLKFIAAIACVPGAWWIKKVPDYNVQQIAFPNLHFHSAELPLLRLMAQKYCIAHIYIERDLDQVFAAE